MFVKKDTRKVVEILYDPADERTSLKLGRREAEFAGSTRMLCESSHAAAFANVKLLSLYGNKLKELSRFSTIAENAPLEEVNLGHNELTELPSSFGELTELRKLWAEDNSFGVFPPPILHLHELRVLRLSGNRMERIPDEIGALTCLEELALDNNRLTSLPDSISALTGLKVLLLRGNQLVTLPASVGALTNLQTLTLSSNKLLELPPELGDAEKLITLSINANSLRTLPASLARLQALKKINVANNRLRYLPRGLLTAWAPCFPEAFLEVAFELAEQYGEADEMETDPAGAAPAPRKFDLILDGNPMVTERSDADGISTSSGIVALTESQFSQPLMNELRKKSRK